MKTTVKGTYSFNKKRKRSANGLALLGFLLLPLSLVIGTQFFAWDVGRNRLPGELFSCMGYSGPHVKDQKEGKESLGQGSRNEALFIHVARGYPSR